MYGVKSELLLSAKAVCDVIQKSGKVPSLASEWIHLLQSISQHVALNPNPARSITPFKDYWKWPNCLPWFSWNWEETLAAISHKCSLSSILRQTPRGQSFVRHYDSNAMDLTYTWQWKKCYVFTCITERFRKWKLGWYMLAQWVSCLRTLIYGTVMVSAVDDAMSIYSNPNCIYTC